MKSSSAITLYMIFFSCSIQLFSWCTSSNTKKAPKNENTFSIVTTVEKVSPKSDYIVPSFKTPLHTYYRITSPYGYRTNPVSGHYKCHTGIDLACATGTPIYASMNGTISFCGYNSIYGNYIIISHDGGYKTKYAHLNSFGTYMTGDKVSTSSVIGYVGSTGQSTGPHCHFEIIQNGNPVDPYSWINF